MYFELEEYESAKKSFGAALKLQDASSQRTTDIKRYIRKCEAELESSDALNPPGPPTPAPAPVPAPAATTISSAPAAKVPSSIVPHNPIK